MFLCLYVLSFLLDALHLGRQTFRGHLRSHESSQYYVVEIHPAITFLRTVKLPFVVITYNCPHRNANNYVQLLTT